MLNGVNRLVIFCWVLPVGVCLGTVPEFPLPPHAEIMEEEENGWQNLAFFEVSYGATLRSVQTRAGRAGWQLRMQQVLSERPPKMSLHLWRLGNHEVLMMLWEVRVDQSVAAWSYVDNEHTREVRESMRLTESSARGRR